MQGSISIQADPTVQYLLRIGDTALILAACALSAQAAVVYAEPDGAALARLRTSIL